MRCAIYTRKSTEEGLDQAFNSLDAQREACVAYVKSQAGEGWKLHPPHYDDGGFSGGTMERPALARLLADIDDGRIDCVVVYKIDRLTRSLADFAKIVERFEKRGVTFVSVTQSFNTTTSMGRLTLNVLLSFAQFEREVTAERIRDKFAASKARGIFMGGNPPLGYDVRDRRLVINRDESETVRYIFRRYLDLRAIGALARDLDARSITTKGRVGADGVRATGGRWFVGPLRYLLRNRVYVGLTLHKGKAWPGQHEPIIDNDLFNEVQSVLDHNVIAHVRRQTTESTALLSGLIRDDRGNRMSPQWNYKNRRRGQCYYVSQAILQHRPEEKGSLPRVPAVMIEDLVLRCLGAAIPDAEPRDGRNTPDRVRLSAFIRNHVKRVVISEAACTIELAANTIMPDLTRLPEGTQSTKAENGTTVTIPGKLQRRGGVRRLENWTSHDWSPTPSSSMSPLALALVRAHRWREMIEQGSADTLDAIAKESGIDRRRIRETIRLSTLATDIQKAILEGRNPPALTLERIIRLGPPLSWTKQRHLLGLTA